MATPCGNIVPEATMPQSVQPRPRGHTRAELVAATIALLEEEGIGGLTLRGVARRAGVSHGAPLKHFDRFSALLSEVAAHGYAILARRVDEADQELPAGAGARARFISASRAYVATAIDHPALFTLMFRFDLLDPTNGLFTRESLNAYRQFLRYIRALQDEGWHPEIDPRALNAVTWSLVHGIATLYSQGALALAIEEVATIDDVVELGLDLVLGPARLRIKP
jgi:AcrR family transcriptional regulator